jgi:sugar transferase (PEP-CTERM/EpsH1 system associated)
LVAFLAGVPVRLHSEHGWDIFDPDGVDPKYRILRRVFSLFVNGFVTVSEDLRCWLVGSVGISASKVTRICNGVDIGRFRPSEQGESPSRPVRDRFHDGRAVVVGSVTRFSPIKDPLNLVEAFIRLRGDPGGAGARLAMIGDGPLREAALARLQEAGVAEFAWLPGSRDDVPELLRGMDVFVLGSLREGISNTILEAMASGLPVVATATGGNNELVLHGLTGMLVETGNPNALAEAIAAYVAARGLRAQHGARARERVVSQYSVATMIDDYRRLYKSRLVPVRA